VENMIRVCPLSALPPGEAVRVEAEPPIAVFHTEEGEVFAIDDTCTRLPRRGLGRGLRGGVPTARLDVRWRRQINTAPVPA
jgi:nitrite reductase/ring-hydroxylating ferredoxin subunit